MHRGNWYGAACDLASRERLRLRLRIGASAIMTALFKMIVRLPDTTAYRFFTRAGVKCDELPLWEGFHAR
ncbi:hypothetical protein MT1_3602 [Pseudomonas sp. MT-1]|nr:hypothetical protein MT1_3602 [Pseudomonas sp. MT-1]